LPADVSVPTRISLDELETLGFRELPELLISRIHARGTSDWLIVTENPGDPDAEARLGVYIQAVVQALGEVNAIQSSRLTWAMLEHLLPASESLAVASRAAVAELASSVDAAAWFSVVTREGAPVLTFGRDLMSVPPPTPGLTPNPFDSCRWMSQSLSGGDRHSPPERRTTATGRRAIAHVRRPPTGDVAECGDRSARADREPRGPAPA
jgi:hypothetical protein